MASSGKLFIILLILATFSSSSIEAREGKLFFSKYIHASTKQTPISEISAAPSPASAPSPAPAHETQSTGYGLWAAGSGMVVPEKETTTTADDDVYPTYKNDEELEAALNGETSSSSSSYDNDDSVYSAATAKGNSDDDRKQYNGFTGGKSGGKFDDNVNLVATNNGYDNVDYRKQYRYNNDEEDNHGYSASARSYNKPYEYQNQNQYQNENGNSYNGESNYNNEETEEEFSDNNDDNQYKLGNARYVRGREQSNNNNEEGVSFATSYNGGRENNYQGNGNGYRERQGMSDTRYVAGGKYYYDVNQQENWP